MKPTATIAKNSKRARQPSKLKAPDPVEAAEAARRKKKDDADASTLERPRMTTEEIICEMARIEATRPWAARDDAQRQRPEWYEFATNYHRSSRAVRKQAHVLLATVPGLTKKRLCEAGGGIAPAGLNKFLENKGECYDNCGVSCSAESGLSGLIDVLEQEQESTKKRLERLRIVAVLLLPPRRGKRLVATILSRIKQSA